ncbi:MAG TPA: type II secretion system protein [Chthonomonadaceae bacterium]|nr:type II secretion system protein [Chthonomonadaceae bacterium]
MRKSAPRGFTLLESLIVLLIMGIGMAVSVPLFISAMKDSQMKQCRSNMMAIANAEEQYKIKTVPHAYTTALTNLVGDFPVVPVCPNGGTYSVTISDGTKTAQNGQTVPSGNIIISCSVSNDGKYAQQIDTY